MLAREHLLHNDAPGTQRRLLSLHYGTPGQGPKACLQASLHADEVPAMLTAHHLRQRLAALEAEGSVRGEIVLVPMANPIGGMQSVLHLPLGRFDLRSGENFNRHYADLLTAVADEVEAQLDRDQIGNVRKVRTALRTACLRLSAESELQSLRKTLLTLAVDADTVLDLHCDNEALLHLYTATPLWPDVQALAVALGAPLTLLATDSGDHPFDEACSMLWPRLNEVLRERQVPGRPRVDLPSACVAVTVELRGEAQVEHALAERDASAILDYLARRGHLVDSPQSGPGSALRRTTYPTAAAGPSVHAEARPLAGSMPVIAPCGGVLVFSAAIGQELQAGDTIAEIVDPYSGQIQILRAPIEGLLYARESRRMARAGMPVAKVAGRHPLRTGKLLSA